MSKVRHLLGISGGKDSAALAIYMKQNYPELNIEYYTTDTGKELDETYQLIDSLENFLGKGIIRLRAFDGSNETPFDHKLKSLMGFLPSAQNRWCTKYLKLDPFEKFVGDDLVVSYVGIRGDEDREGYISKKSNIQSIFPFRRNIWSEDITQQILGNSNLGILRKCYEQQSNNINVRTLEVVDIPITPQFSVQRKLQTLLDLGVREFNNAISIYLQSTSYPLSAESNYALLANEDNLVKADIFRILEESGVGVPKYYNKIDFEVNGKQGQYARSRSGCFFCFFQQNIEWIWLYEQHPEKFNLAKEYEKNGYTWNQDETLDDLVQPGRMAQIKEEYLKRTERVTLPKSPYLIDILSESEDEGCASCFI